MRYDTKCTDWHCPACRFINHRAGDVTGPYACEDCGRSFDSVRLLQFPPVTTCEPTDDGRPTLDTRYRIYVSESNRADIRMTLVHFVEAATILPAVGFWQGEAETCHVVEIIGHGDTYGPTIRELAVRLRDKFGQDSVLLTVEDVRGELI